MKIEMEDLGKKEPSGNSSYENTILEFTISLDEINSRLETTEDQREDLKT